MWLLGMGGSAEPSEEDKAAQAEMVGDSDSSYETIVETRTIMPTEMSL
jgi:hypothetical protein